MPNTENDTSGMYTTSAGRVSHTTHSYSKSDSEYDFVRKHGGHVVNSVWHHKGLTYTMSTVKHK